MTNDNKAREWMTLSEAADHLGVAQSTVRKWADSGRLEAFRTPGGHRRFLRPQLDEFLYGPQIETPLGRNGRTAEILVVDDDAAVRAVMRALLEAEGFVVREAHDARSGILSLNDRLPDLMLLDIAMPGGMDGWQMMQKIREMLDVDQLPIIVFSGAIDPDELSHAKTRGAQGFAKKGNNPHKIVQQARIILEGEAAIV